VRGRILREGHESKPLIGKEGAIDSPAAGVVLWTSKAEVQNAIGVGGKLFIAAGTGRAARMRCEAGPALGTAKEIPVLF
jgi:hypothetical protein